MGVSPWELLSTHRVFQSPWLTVLEKMYRLPRGGQIEPFYVCSYPAWVCVIAVTGDGSIVLIRQYRPGLDRVEWELPAGVVDGGEQPLDAARRELAEETGFTGGEWSHFNTLSPGPGTHDNLSHAFVVRGVSQTAAQRLDSTEDIEVAVRSESDVRRMLRRGDIQNALHTAPLLLFLSSSLREDSPGI